MAFVDSFENAEALILGAFKDALDKLAKHVKSIEALKIDEVVYAAYTPRRYVRRYSAGGLKDHNNMLAVTSVNLAEHEASLRVVNITPAKRGKHFDYSHIMLPELVEYGHNWRDGQVYHYAENYAQSPQFNPNRDFRKPRPFTAKTQEALDTNKYQTIEFLEKFIQENIGKL